MTLYPDLAGKGVLITGGATGIGAAIAELFAAQGCKVAVLDRDAAAGAMLAARHGVKVYSCDVTDITALRTTIAEAVAQIGIVRVLINNVANDARHTLDAITPESFDDSVAVNLRPHIFAAQAVAPFMRAEGGGAIITLGSNAAALGLAGYPLYVAAKAAIEGLTKALARELGPGGIPRQRRSAGLGENGAPRKALDHPGSGGRFDAVAKPEALDSAGRYRRWRGVSGVWRRRHDHRPDARH
jgi:D-xylose 1-dehydrogenase